MAMDKKTVGFLLKIGDAAAINLGGVAFKPIDTAINKVPFFSSVVGVSTTPTQGKPKKMILYTGAGLIIDGVLDFVLKEDSDSVDPVALGGRYISDFLYGLSAATYAADPVIQAFPPLYKSVASQQTQPQVQQRVVMTGNLLS